MNDYKYGFQYKKRNAGYEPEIPQLEQIAIEASEKLSPQAIVSMSIDEVEQELRRLGCDPNQRLSAKLQLMIQIHRSKIPYRMASSCEPMTPDLSRSPSSPGSSSDRSPFLQAVKALIKTIEARIIAFTQELQRRAPHHTIYLSRLTKVGRKGMP
jgi:hypothetical protein